MDGFPFALYHVNGCGGPCFLLDHMPAEGELTEPGRSANLDGSAISDAEPMKCGTCGEFLYSGFYHNDLSVLFVGEYRDG